MTRQDVIGMVGGKPRRLSENTIVFEHKNGHASPMTVLEQRMWDIICSLTKG
jgi:hypothetical protein